MASSSSAAISRANKRRREDESSSQEKYSFKGRRLKRQTKHILMNVMEYFEKEAKKSKGHPNVLEKVSKATGISPATIKIVRAEFAKGGGDFDSPLKRYNKSRVRKDPDDFDREALRRKIHSLYEKRENLSLNKTFQHAKEAGIFSGGRTTLHRVLKDMGFKYQVIKNKRANHWDADGLNEELLEPFIIDIGSDNSDDNISDSGEDVDSMEEDDSAEDNNIQPLNDITSLRQGGEGVGHAVKYSRSICYKEMVKVWGMLYQVVLAYKET